MAYTLTAVAVGHAQEPKKLKEKALLDIRKILETEEKDPESVTLNDIELHRVILKGINGSTFEIQEAMGNERPHKKKFNDEFALQAYLSKVLDAVTMGHKC